LCGTGGEDITNSQGEVALKDPSSSKRPERTGGTHCMADIGGLVRMVENSLVKVFAISTVNVPDGGLHLLDRALLMGSENQARSLFRPLLPH